MSDRDKFLLLEKLKADKELDNLQKLSKALNSTGLNIFKITGMDSQEIKHSNTIAWFLNPRESHNLGSLFFREFITLLSEEKPDYFKVKCINVQELARKDFDDAEVIRESEANIDVLFKSKENKFVLCIENKVKAGIGKTQLDDYYNYIEKEYKGYKKVFVLLSLSGYGVPNKKSNNAKEWTSISYRDVLKILRSILENQRKNIEQKIQHIIEDYIELLEKILYEKRGIVEKYELLESLSKLHKNHKDAIKLLQSVEKDSKLSKSLFVKHLDAIKLLQSQTVINRIQKVIAAILEELADDEKIIYNKSSLDKNFSGVFHTYKMDKYLNNKNEPKQKKAYIYRIRLTKEQLIIELELQPFKRFDYNYTAANKILKFAPWKKTNTEISKENGLCLMRIKEWNIENLAGFDGTDAEAANATENLRTEIIKAVKEILKCEEKII